MIHQHEINLYMNIHMSEFFFIVPLPQYWPCLLLSIACNLSPAVPTFVAGCRMESQPAWIKYLCFNGPLVRYVRLRVAHAPGMPGTFFPPTDFKGNCRVVCRDRLPAVAGKTFPAFPAHAHPQSYVFGKRPMMGPSWTVNNVKSR